MVSTESPAVARRRLRLAIRRAREARGLTQQQVADSLDWSLSKVNRLEAGEVTISPTDVRALLRLLQVTDKSTVESMVEDARAARKRGWWHEPRYRDHLTPATIQLIQFEHDATAIRSFQPAFIPGLLQTREYAEMLFDRVGRQIDDQTRAARIDVRMRRSEQVFGRPDPPTILVLLDESALERALGQHRVLADQLFYLLRQCDTPHVIIRVVPSADSAMALQGSFIIFDFAEDANAVLYQEFGSRDELKFDSSTVAQYRTTFEETWQKALDRDASRRLIHARAAEVLSLLDRKVNDR